MIAMTGARNRHVTRGFLFGQANQPQRQSPILYNRVLSECVLLRDGRKILRPRALSRTPNVPLKCRRKDDENPTGRALGNPGIGQRSAGWEVTLFYSTQICVSQTSLC